MIDLHCHVLPGMDDGAKDESTALAMLKIAAENGITGIVATPHVGKMRYKPAWPEIIKSCGSLTASAARAGIAIGLFPGAEVAIQPENLDLLLQPGPYCINGGNYIIVELTGFDIPLYAEEFLFVLQTRGFLPILSHPELNREIVRRPEILREWIRKGILMQLDAESVTGLLGSRVKQFAEWMLLQNLVHCIASDAHGVLGRRPALERAVAAIVTLLGPERAGEIITNSDKILNNEEVVPQFPGTGVQPSRKTLLEKLLPT